jgi:hypothetical protein
VICLIQRLTCFVLIGIGLAVLLLGGIAPHQALARIGMLVAFLLLGPAVIIVLVKGMLLPIVTAVWSAAKPVLLLLALIFGLLLILSAVIGAVRLYRNSNSGERRVHSGEE